MTTLKTDHWVRTADGAIGRVRYVHEVFQTADIALNGSFNDQVSLPLAELRRIPDPAENRPPIEGLPVDGERPRCAFCNRRLAPDVRKHYADVATTARNPLAPRVARRTFEGWTGYPRRAPLFHSLGCAENFAIAAHKAGYRVRRTK